MNIPSGKNLTKLGVFVIFCCAFGVFSAGCASVSSGGGDNSDRNSQKSGEYREPAKSGTIASAEINESSGITASRCNEGVLWTHNDSGDEALIYALNAKGEKLGTYKVSGAQNIDWEDIAAFQDKRGRCFLYIGDIGDNGLERDLHTIYRVAEPKVEEGDRGSSRKEPRTTDSAEAIRFTYPDGRWDSETLMINPQTGNVYIFSKRLGDPSVIYKLADGFSINKPNKLEKIAELTLPAFHLGLLTGGDISPDGRRAVVCDYFSAYEMVLPKGAKNFDEIWKQKPLIVELGERKQGEAIGYSADGNSLFATSEKINSPMIEVKRKQ